MSRLKTVFKMQQLLCMILHTFASSLPDGNLKCFVDLSNESDRRTDIVISVHGQNNDDEIKAFKQIKDDGNLEFEIYNTLTSNGQVQSISAGDFNHDGIADLFVVTGSGTNYQLNIWKDNDQNEFQKLDSNTIPIQLSDPNVLIIDANNEFTPDIFGKRQDNQQEGFWFHDYKNEQTSAEFMFVPLNVDNNDIIMQSVSFIDLDQDCRADLVYIKESSKEIKMIKGHNFKDELQHKIETLITLSSDIQQTRMYFADINQDGAIDIVVPGKNNNQLYIWLQKKNKGFKQMCDNESILPIEWQSLLLKFENSPTYKFSDDSSIIIQDINMDSHIEIIAVLYSVSGDQKVFVSSLIAPFENLKNIQDISGKFDDLISEKTDNKMIKNIAFFHSGVFPLGLHFLVEFNDNKIEWINLKDIIKNENYGFLSVLPLNDAPINRKRYGGTMAGALVKAFFRARDGKSIFLISSTGYQSNNINYLLPFCFIGLGEPENYIEKLIISYSMYDTANYFTQPGVPPNSELVLYSYPRDKKGEWRLETFLAPYLTPQALAIIIAVVMSILASIWLYLEIQEKKSVTDVNAGSATNNFFF